jgi:hypothetical protein
MKRRSIDLSNSTVAQPSRGSMKLDIPAGDFAGYIFDCDGTLVDTMPLHFRAWSGALQEAGLKAELSERLF